MIKRILTALFPTLLIILTACSPVDWLVDPFVPQADSSVPGRMITSMEIIPYPADDSLSRSYTDLDTLTSILQKLRNMDTDETPQEDPHTDAQQHCLTITVIYANGDEESYHLLENQYIQNPDGNWYIVNPDKSIELSQFIQNTPGED